MGSSNGACNLSAVSSVRNVEYYWLRLYLVRVLLVNCVNICKCMNFYNIYVWREVNWFPTGQAGIKRTEGLFCVLQVNMDSCSR